MNRVEDHGVFVGYMVDCPGCGQSHMFRTEPDAGRPVWEFDGDHEAPTFTPSLRARWGPMEPGGAEQCCHFYLTAGIFHFRPDSTHALAGKEAPMVHAEDGA